jgi:hypothetical protein
MLKSHYGVVVNSETPITGVVPVHDVPWLVEEFNNNGLDLDFIAYCKDGGDEDLYEQQDATIVLGFKEQEDGKYDVDENADFAAIMLGSTIHVVKSLNVVRGALCSPCCPGQASVDEPGDFLCYAPSKMHFGEGKAPAILVYAPKVELAEIEAYGIGPVAEAYKPKLQEAIAKGDLIEQDLYYKSTCKTCAFSDRDADDDECVECGVWQQELAESGALVSDYE